jgi:hypothetical protein
VSDEQVARFNVLLEHIDAKVTALAEGHDALAKRVDVGFTAVEQRLERVETRLDRIEHHVGLNGTPSKKRSSRVSSRPSGRKK